MMSTNNGVHPLPVDISEQDVVEAMTSIQGYIDITPGDFKEIYRAAYSLAIKRLLSSLQASDLMTGEVHLVNQEMSLVAAAALLAEKG